jgi:L-amino acid N-acyltransferase YncA
MSEGEAEEAELVRLRDGSQVTLRPATARDEPALRAFLAGLSAEARRLRFFSGAADTDAAAHWAAVVSPDRYGLVAHDRTGAIVAHATYIQLNAPRGEPTRAEVAVEVADHLHGRGLATILIERLAAVAQARGVARFVAEVLPENRAMLDVFRDGFDARLTFHEGADTVEFPTSAWRLALHRFS